MTSRAFPGYSAVAGEWYPAIVYPRPAKYHKYAKQDVYQLLYPDLINKETDTETKGE